MKTEVYDIFGMHCAACSAAVEKVTRKLNGVETSEVNLPMNRMTITYDEALVKPEMIISKIEKAGFGASIHVEDEETKPVEAVDEDKEIKHFKYRLITAVTLGALLLYISMGQMLVKNLPIPDMFSMHSHPVNFAILQLLITIPILVLGKNFFINGYNSLFHGNPNMDTLVAVSSTASLLYSIVMTFTLSDNPANVHNLYYESAGIVVALVMVGKYMEAHSKEKTKSAITKLMQLSPDTAIVVKDGVQTEVPTKEVKVGDIVLVKSGAKIPLDGVITEGSGSVNESMLTGESLPIEKTVGSEVIGGSVSQDGTFYVQVKSEFKDSALAKIIKFVEDAQGKKAPIAKVADKVAGVFVPVVMTIAIVAAIVWLFLGYPIAFAIKIFTSVLVIACPCAMGLATPTAIIVGTGLGASKGILIRNGEVLETTHKTQVAVFDKTGTITQGKPIVTDIATFNGETEESLLTLTASLEKLSNHPLSKAICNAAEERNIEANYATREFANVMGMGLKARLLTNEDVLIGNKKLFDSENVSIDEVESTVTKLANEGKTPIIVAKNNAVIGIIAIADIIKEDAIATINKLREMNVKTVMLTGDNQKTADLIAKKVNVDKVFAEVLPTEKADIIKSLQADGSTVMMVGDGINDAPALTQADVGCAIGNGSDIAIESAEIVLMGDNLDDVCKAIKLSHYTIRNIKQNLFWAFFYNILGIPVACGVLYPFTHMLLSPMIGGLAMSLSSLFVVTNALRLRGKKLD